MELVLIAQTQSTRERAASLNTRGSTRSGTFLFYLDQAFLVVFSYFLIFLRIRQVGHVLRCAFCATSEDRKFKTQVAGECHMSEPSQVPSQVCCALKLRNGGIS
jgi:hypothetical protein